MQAAFYKKWYEVYQDYIKPYSTTLSAGEEADIDAFYTDMYDWHIDNLDYLNDLYLGNNWTSDNLNDFSFSVGWGNPAETSKLLNSGGTPLSEYATSNGQQVFNNRGWFYAEFIHMYAIVNNDLTWRNNVIQHVKNAIKLAMFPDGMLRDMIWRTEASPNHNLGVTYGTVILEGMVNIAMHEEIAWEQGYITANGWSRVQLFDYTTTEGLTNGVDLPGPEGNYLAATTAGGPKGILQALQKLDSVYLDTETPDIYSTGSTTKIDGADKRFAGV